MARDRNKENRLSLNWFFSSTSLSDFKLYTHTHTSIVFCAHVGAVHGPH